jgi:hypothetical protein
MENLEAKIHQLVVQATGEQKKLTRTFATRPNRNLIAENGKIFGLIEIESNNQAISKLIDLIIDEIKNNYYGPTDPLKIQDALAEPNNLSVNEKFETALKKTNLAIAAFIESNQLPVEIDKINITIALIHEQDIYLATVGQNCAILFNNINKISFRIINILDRSQTSLLPIDPFKLFSQIISGKIRSNDIVFISTSNILDYFSLDKIKNIITGNLIIESTNEFKKILENLKAKDNFGLLVLELEKSPVFAKRQEPTKQFNYNKTAFGDSIKELIKTEKATEKLLSPKVMPEFKKYFALGQVGLFDLSRKLANKFKMSKSIPPKGGLDLSRNTNLKNKLRTWQPRMNNFKKSIPLPINLKFPMKFNKIFVIGKYLTTITASFFKKITRTIFNQKTKESIGLIFKKLFGHWLVKYKKLPTSSRILLIITIVLTILFIQSVAWLGIKTKREQKIITLNQIILDISNKKNEAESSLVYRDEDQARKILIEAKNQLAGLNPPLKSQQDQIDSLNRSIVEQLTKLQRIINLSDPIQIINFANIDSQAKMADFLITDKKNIYTQNSNNKSLYRANLDSRDISALPANNLSLDMIMAAINFNDSEILIMNDINKIFLFNPSNDNLSDLKLTLSNNAKIVGLAAYNNRVYLIDQSNSQILRYNKSNTELTGGASWLKQDGLDLTKAVSLIVDGQIYVLNGNGEIIKLENGKTVDFKLHTIDPALASPTKIKSPNGSKYLYVLDPPTKRLVVFNKDGSLVNQYISDRFDDLKDFTVLESEKKIYLLSGTSIYGIAAEHLE